jgi:hypothetical protein
MRQLPLDSDQLDLRVAAYLHLKVPVRSIAEIAVRDREVRCRTIEGDDAKPNEGEDGGE